MSGLLKSRGYLMKCLGFVLLFGFISLGAIGGCNNNGGGQDGTRALTENDFAQDPGTFANPRGGVVVIFLEPPDSEEPDNDTGGVGNDVIPLTYTRTLEHTYCWEDDDGEAGHFMELDDSDGNEILRIDVNGECVTMVIEAGDYVMTIHHDGKKETTHPVFIIPNPENNQQARETDGLINRFKLFISNILLDLQDTVSKDAKAQTTSPLDTLITTGKCIGCDLRKVDLSFRDLVNVDLTGADLRRANLSNSNFTGVEFTGADLTAADLSNSIFIRADFTITDLDRALFTGANFGGAIWIDGECRCQSGLVYVANPIDDNVLVIDTATNTVGQTISVGVFPRAVAISRDGSTVYVTNDNDSTVSVIDTATNTVGATISIGVFPRAVAVSPDGSTVYVANAGDDTVSVIDTATNTVGATIPVGTSPAGVAVSPDGSTVYVANRNDDNVSVIDTSTNTVRQSISIGVRPSGIAVSPDGSTVYVANENDGTVSVIDTVINTVGQTISVGMLPVSVAVSPDGSTVYVANEDDGTVSVINTATNTVGQTISVGGFLLAVAISPDGSTVYVTNEIKGTVSVIDTATNTVIDTIPLKPSFGLAVSPNISIGECVGCQ